MRGSSISHALGAAFSATSSGVSRSAKKRREQYSPPEDFWSPYSATTLTPKLQPEER